MLPRCSIVCFYCNKSFSDSQIFRLHMEYEHSNFPVNRLFSYITGKYLKVDCTDLRCRMCGDSFENLQDSARHLVDEHKTLDLDLQFDLELQPFKFDDGFKCVLCSEKFPGLRPLSLHMQSHYYKYICELCGKLYKEWTSLQTHVKKAHISSKQYCNKCKVTFKTVEERRNHLTVSSICRPYPCKACEKRFISWNQKLSHEAKVHGIPKPSYTCSECTKVFTDSSKYRNHFKAYHSTRASHSESE
jgi:hypothetical protein